MTTTGTGTESVTWYYVGSFGQLGPLTLDQLEELIDGGVIERETYVWNAGMASWLPAAQVPQLASALGRRLPFMEPPPTPASASRPTSPQVGTASSPHLAAPPSYGTSVAPMGLRSAYGVHASPYGMLSDRSRVVAGILNIVFPGVGRLYLGYSALGVIQLLAPFLSCGLLWIWSIVDGIMILTGRIKIDGYGRILKD